MSAMHSTASHHALRGLDLDLVPTPCFVIDLAKLRANGEMLAEIQWQAGCHILLALKAFAMWQAFPEINRFLSGSCASGIHEAKLGREEFGKDVHVYSPAFSQADMDEVVKLADHIIFNSLGQYERFYPQIQNLERRIELGIRINPECRVSEHAKYDPSAPMCRFGVRWHEMGSKLPPGISGLHFHNLCEQGVEPLRKTLNVVEAKFGNLIHQADWINFGGGHYITNPGYDSAGLVELIRNFQARYDTEVYLEPGEAVGLHAGALVASVLDVVERGDESFAVLDVSASNHMPDILEMPYKPEVMGAKEPGEAPYTYQLGALTCLSCDVLGNYSFDAPLQVGQKLVFMDQAVYTMVKMTNFNGLKPPSIATYDSWNGAFQVISDLGYEDYKMRLSKSLPSKSGLGVDGGLSLTSPSLVSVAEGSL